MKKIFIIWLALVSSTAFAFPKAPFNALNTTIDNKANQDYDFEGIVKLSGCSGALMRFAGQPMSSKALVLTNGHCLGRPFIGQGEAIINKRKKVRMKIADKNMRFHSVKSTRIVYATMTGTDMAIYELSITYDEIHRKWAINPLDYLAEHPFISTPIEVISGYWERGYRCSIDSFIFELREAGWIFSDSIKYTSDGCHTKGGTSGSPIIEEGTRNIIGINNTGNERGRECTMNNPCEVDEDGTILAIQGASYGQQTYQVYSCLRPDFQIDTTLDGCMLQD